MKNILLIEPRYRNKYPPLGLMKLSTYHKNNGDRVLFIKGEPLSVLYENWDRIYITTLFSFEWNNISKSIDFGIKASGNNPKKVFVGGIAASLMHDEFVKEPRWKGIRFISGLLTQPPPQALQLRIENQDFGLNDFSSPPIEYMTPDYSILDDIDYIYPVRDAYFGYSTRGCVRKCHFCGVPKLEGAQVEMPPLEKLVNGVIQKHGEKKDLLLMDNNVTASTRYKEIIAEIVDLGFHSGAKLNRNGKRIQRRVDFNQGVDARILSKSPMFLREMSKICIDPLRIAFDHLGARKVYEISVRMAADNGLNSLSNYMLYNFKDKPFELYARMKLNIDLNEELGLKIWSFPMRYQPVTFKDRSFIGDHWNNYYLRSFQIILQATHGVVGHSSSFFEFAFGKNTDDFLQILSLPHRFIFNRRHYQDGDGQPILDEYTSLRNRLSTNQESELLNHITHPIGSDTVRKNYYTMITSDRSNPSWLRELLGFYVTDSNTGTPETLPGFDISSIPNQERKVEDAGLFSLA